MAMITTLNLLSMEEAGVRTKTPLLRFALLLITGKTSKLRFNNVFTVVRKRPTKPGPRSTPTVCVSAAALRFSQNVSSHPDISPLPGCMQTRLVPPPAHINEFKTSKRSIQELILMLHERFCALGHVGHSCTGEVSS